MARTFNGTSDKITVTPSAAFSSVSLAIPASYNSGIRRSHPNPFVLANGNLVLGYCTNEDGTNFVYKQSTSMDGGVTFGSPVFIGGGASSGSDTFEGKFAQLSGGTLFCVYGFGSNVRYRTSSDNGATWSSETTI